MLIKYLESSATGDDVDLSCLKELGDLVCLNVETEEEMQEAVRDEDVIIVNKLKVNAQTIGHAEKLKLVCEAATGIDNIDVAYLKQRGIEWRNVAGYSTDAVAQHTFAMAFYLEESLAYYDQYVKSGAYIKNPTFTHFAKGFHELAGKTWGIIGLGAIGRKVATIAQAFGCRVVYYSASGQKAQVGYEQVDFETLLKESDYLSIHAPLNEYTMHLMDQSAFEKMKESAILINVGRGPIVDQQALHDALVNGEIRAAALDVLEKEPMQADNPLFRIKDSEKLLITPHMAWAGVEARNRLIRTIADHIRTVIR